ncbi:MAG TPA: aminotransferase class V-fold PLP-dependent enzyme [Planctomycetaceae bacterium]|nr:aminotransferase class V-fold PLP-dependent enzyme [Planctomycetaceae bacterium]
MTPPETRGLCDAWTIPGDVTYLNHGSFGPSPRVVQDARSAWSARLERQPMQFFVRDMETELDAAAATLADLVGADADDLIFVDNATAGMNIVAASVDLRPGDEVLLSDHEYGAVVRIWREACRRAGAALVVRPLPSPLDSAEAVADELLSGITDRTRLIVVSHVTSPTAAILPVALICRRARERGVAVCIDGPHALAMIPVNLRQIDCDFYAASCHKWLSAPFGSGFLYVARRRQRDLRPAVMSWGGSISGRPASWKDEFSWSGTRDPAAFLAVPAAIAFLETYGLDDFRRDTHQLAASARRRIGELTGLEPLVPEGPAWYGSMVAVPLPATAAEPVHPAQPDPLQAALWQRFRVEAPVMRWQGRRLLRVSCHLYNGPSDIDRLVAALAELTRGGNPLS